MENDYKKILWKIEELWNKYYDSVSDSYSNKYSAILKNYENNISEYNSDFKLIKKFDFLESDSVVHVDDYGKYKGLLNSQLLFKDKKPIYLFDNHNKIIYPFVELFESIGKPLNIVHIDAHPDDAKFLGLKQNNINLQNSKDVISQTRISDFFDALSETNIINFIYSITHSDSFEFFLSPEKPYILSLDIDIFGPEGDFAELKDKVRAIALAWNRADAICIATSPGFIDQMYAKEIIKIFIKNK